MENNSVYFGADIASATASTLIGKVDEWSNSLESNGFIEKLRSSYFAYHGAYYADVSSGHQVTFGGEQGELVNLPVNHYRNIAQHMLTMVTSNRPAMQARAVNTDYKSLVQASLANSILDYYMREKKLEVYLKKAVEFAIVLGSGFVKMEWDATKGELVDYIEETKTKIYEGDIVFSNLNPFDVVFDGSKESNDHDWILVRSWKNKFDLAAKYPEVADKIKALPTKSDKDKFRLGVTNLVAQTDDVQMLEFYHKRTECMPDGRYMLFLTEDLVLQDMPLPYRVIPIFRISPSDVMGTPHGYTPMFDLLPLQEAANSLYSTILTNENAFGVQNILNPRGSDISVNSLQGGLNVIEYNPATAGGGKPEPLQLTATPKEIFDFLNIITQSMETLSGVNSVARGNPEASLKSGTALALIQSMALQFMSGLQESYVELIEEIGTGIIKVLQDYAATPRLVAISGVSNRNYMKEFSSKDIENIGRVVVDVGNPMSQTTAGKVQMAQELIQYGEITPKQYLSIINTGNLDALTENIEHQNLLMRSENEAIMNGETPPVLIIDAHKEHIDYHSSLLSDPDLRKDPGLVQRVMDHIQAHITQLQQGNPELLQLLNQQPLPPPPQPGPPPGQNGPPGPPQGPGGPQGGPPQQQGPGGPPQGQPPQPTGGMNRAAVQTLQPPTAGQTGPQMQAGKISGPGLPTPQRLPNLPTVQPGLLPNPALQQEMMNNLRK